MISIKFKNKYGTIAMGGRDHPSHKILEADGFETPDVTRTTITYFNEPGQSLQHEHIDARTITLSVDIVNNGMARRELARISKILSIEGELYIKSGFKERKIGAKCTSLKPSKPNEAFLKVVIQFVCDYPYFSDFTPTEWDIYKTVSLLSDPFTLPAVFSKRVTAATVTNKGDVSCEPVIYLRAGNEIVNAAADNTVVIKNNTTNQKLTIQYDFELNETLTVDIPNRRIYSSKAPDTLIYCISNDTFLSDFCLAEGNNDIEVSGNADHEITAVLECSNKYVEAVLL